MRPNDEGLTTFPCRTTFRRTTQDLNGVWSLRVYWSPASQQMIRSPTAKVNGAAIVVAKAAPPDYSSDS